MRAMRKRGFTLPELAVLTFLILILSCIVLSRFAVTHRPMPRLKCVSHLKNVGLAFRIYATDNNDQFPGMSFLSNRNDLGWIKISEVYASLSNELSTSLILYCSKDAKRKPAPDFAHLSSENISYFASLNTSEQTPGALLAGDRNLQLDNRLLKGVFAVSTNTALSWSKDIHEEQGNVAMSDGSVQQANNARLKQVIHDQSSGLATNLLIFP